MCRTKLWWEYIFLWLFFFTWNNNIIYIWILWLEVDLSTCTDFRLTSTMTMCGVSLKDRKRSLDLYSLLGVLQSVEVVVRRGRLRWFGYLERRSADDWVSACRRVEVAGARCKGWKRKTWTECVDDDMEVMGLHPEWAIFRVSWRNFIWANV